MFTTDLKPLLKDIYSDKEKIKTVLIEGEWGCGKTYAIKDFVDDEDEKVSYLYVSLFGFSSPNEITVRLAEKLDSSFIINSGGSFIIKSSSDEKKYNKSLIIFDDIERKNKQLSFSSIYGIVNSLKTLGFKVVCVVCEKERFVEEDDYLFFKDKTFDLIVPVEANPDVCKKMVGEDIKISPSLLKSAKDNLRSILRAKNRYNIILSKAKEMNIDSLFPKLDTSNTALFEHVVLAERCFFSSNDEEPKYGEKDIVDKIIYKNDVNAFGRYAANELSLLKTSETWVSLDKIRNLLTLFNTFDYDTYFSNYFNKINDELLVSAPLLYSEPFLLGDSDRKKYEHEFYDNYQKIDFNDPKNQKILTNFLRTSLRNTSIKKKNLLLNTISESISVSSGDEITRKLKMAGEDNSIVSSFSNELEKRLDERRKEEVRFLLFDSMQNSKYGEMIEILNASKSSNDQQKEDLLEFLQGNGFGLPDLSKTISEDAWTYCHQIAKFVSGTSYEKMFIKTLEAQCLLYERSFAVREKCNALVKYNLSNHYEDFFVKHPIKANKITPKDLIKLK